MNLISPSLNVMFSLIRYISMPVVKQQLLSKLTEDGHMWLVFSTTDCEANSLGL